MHSAHRSKTDLPLSLALVALFCALPGVCLYLNNAFEMPLRDVLLPGGCSVLLGLLCFFLCLAIFRNPNFSALAAVVGMGLFLNFNFVIDLVNAVHPVERLRPCYIAAAVVFVLLFALLLLFKQKKPIVLHVLSRLTLLASCSILLVSLIFALPTLIDKSRSPKFHQTQSSADSTAVMPNLYYLLIDEYASFVQIQNCFGYDNQAFHDFLTESGFNVSDSSHNRYKNSSPNIAEIVNLAPVITDKFDKVTLLNQFNNGQLYYILEKMGYDLYQIGNLFPFAELMPYAQSHATAEDGSAAAEILIKNSMLRSFSRALYWETVFESRAESFAYFNNPAHYAKSNRATFFYVCSPHVPYYCDANGNRVDMEHWVDREDPQYYLGQYRYITSQLEMMITSILENDPHAIILLQSDHGQRDHGSMNDRRRILNALYFDGQSVDIAGLCGYNTWRALLNALGGDYPILEEGPLLDQ